MNRVAIKFREQYGKHRKGAVVDVHPHVADALCDAPGPDGEPFADRLVASPRNRMEMAAPHARGEEE